MRYMTIEQSLAWCAGIIDGEGSLGYGNQPLGRRQCYIQVTNTDPRMLLALKSFLKHGHFRELKISPLGTQRIWEWKVQNKEEVREILKLLIPLLLVKQEEAELLLSSLDSTDLYKGLALQKMRDIRKDRGTHALKVVNGDKV